MIIYLTAHKVQQKKTKNWTTRQTDVILSQAELGSGRTSCFINFASIVPGAFTMSGITTQADHIREMKLGDTLRTLLVLLSSGVIHQITRVNVMKFVVPNNEGIALINIICMMKSVPGFVLRCKAAWVRAIDPIASIKAA
jgi:hypothetical protein